MKPRSFTQVIATGVRSLMLHKLRSLLTTLGVLFGTSSVIAMLAIGEGASFEAQRQYKELGSQNVILRSVKPPEVVASRLVALLTEDFATRHRERVVNPA